MMEIKENTIVIPEDEPEKNVPALDSIEQYWDKLNVISYTLSAESLENVILRMLSSNLYNILFNQINNNYNVI